MYWDNNSVLDLQWLNWNLHCKGLIKTKRNIYAIYLGEVKSNNKDLAYKERLSVYYNNV